MAERSDLIGCDCSQTDPVRVGKAVVGYWAHLQALRESDHA